MLHVDLATGATHEGAAPVADDGWGGPIAALRILAEGLDDPLPPVVLVAGAVGGVAAPGLARMAAVGVSPLSGRIAETRAEGPFAAGLRRAGVTGLALHGAAAEPVVVVVRDGAVTLTPATTLIGLDTGPATDALLDTFGVDAAVAVIGPAGEHRVPYASVVTCRHHPLPRLGFGAVLGERHVKAIVCVGTEVPPVASPLSLARIAFRYGAAIPGNPLAAWQKADPGFGIWRGAPGFAMVDNFRDTATPSGMEPEAAPAPESVAPCPGCPTDCIKVFGGAGLHQEALVMLGDLALNARCLQAGLDPVSLGARLAAAGIAPTAAIISAIAGGEAEPPLTDELMAVGGVELPPFDPRVQPNLALAGAAAPIGPRYDIVEHDFDFVAGGLDYSFDEVRAIGVTVPREPGALDPVGTAILMRLYSGLDALNVCLFAATPTRPLLRRDVEDLVAAVTGERPDILALGARRLQLMNDINARLGVVAETLPDRFFDEPVQAGPWAGAVLDRDAFDAALRRLRADLFEEPDPVNQSTIERTS